MNEKLEAGLIEIFGEEQDEYPLDPVLQFSMHVDDDEEIEDKLKHMRYRKEKGCTMWAHASLKNEDIPRSVDKWMIWPVPRDSSDPRYKKY